MDNIILWHNILDDLKRFRDHGWINNDIFLVDNAKLPETFYANKTPINYLFFGFGSGVLACRVSTWDSNSKIIVIESNHRVACEAKLMARRYNLSNLLFVRSFSEIDSDFKFNKLIYDSGINKSDLELILKENPNIEVIGRHYDTLGSDDLIYSILSENASSFDVINLNSNLNIHGKKNIDPLLTVIVALHEFDQMLERTIVSLMGQTLQSLEVLVAFNSDDKQSSDVMRRWGVEYPNKLRLLPLTGVSKGEAINVALKAANGKYVAFLEAFDWCESRMFERLIGSIGPSCAEVVACSYHRVRPEDNMRFQSSDVQQGWVNNSGDFILADPVIGRFIFSREFLKQNYIDWPDNIPASIQNYAFQFLVFTIAKRVIGVHEPYYNCRAIPGVPVFEPSHIELLVERLRQHLFNHSNYSNELMLKRLILKIYKRSYGGSRGILVKFSVLRSFVASMNRCSLFFKPIEYILLK